ncbi:MAG: hypothetical protein QXI16_00520, partial [Sulfolobaceae archaeon]
DVFPEADFTTIETDSSFTDLNNNSLIDLFSNNLFEEMPFLLDFDNELPNSVSDTIDYIDNKYYYTQRVKEYTLQSNDIEQYSIVYTYIDRIRIYFTVLPNVIIPQIQAFVDNSSTIEGFIEGVNETEEGYDSVDSYYKYGTNNIAFYLYVPKGTYANLSEAQADLADTKIWYQLATPIVTELDYMFYSTLYQTTFDLLTEEQIKLQMDEFVEKPYLFIDYETFGISSITTVQMDMYYNYYLDGFDNVTFGNTVSAYTNLQSLMSQNADLNYKLYIKDLSTDIKNIQNTQYKLTQNDDNILVSDINDEYLMTIYDDNTYISNISIDNLEFTFEGYNSIGTIQGTIPTKAQPFLLIIPLFLIVGFIFLVLKEE